MSDPSSFRGLQVVGFAGFARGEGEGFTDDTLIVCQRFVLVERYPEPVPA